MRYLLQEKADLEATIATLLINKQPYKAHMEELLDLLKQIKDFK